MLLPTNIQNDWNQKCLNSACVPRIKITALLHLAVWNSHWVIVIFYMTIDQGFHGQWILRKWERKQFEFNNGIGVGLVTSWRYIWTANYDQHWTNNHHIRWVYPELEPITLKLADRFSERKDGHGLVVYIWNIFPDILKYNMVSWEKLHVWLHLEFKQSKL